MTTHLDKEIDRLQPPQSLDAEQSVLGAIMKDDEAINVAIDALDEPGHFYVPKHRLIYQAMLDLYQEQQPCDITTVSNCLLSLGNLEKVGGRVYLVELVEGVASTANIKAYADIVLEKSLARRLIEECNEITRSAYTSSESVPELLDAAESAVFGIAEKQFRKGFKPISSAVPDSLDQIERIQQGDIGLGGVPTGFHELDQITLGLKPGELTIIAGRPSMGKSALAWNIAEVVAGTEEHRTVGIFSIEMSIEELTLRAVCSRARVDKVRLQYRRLTDDEFKRLTLAGNAIAGMNILIDDSGSLTNLQLHAKARRLKAKYPNLAVIIVDYVQLMHATSRHENRQQEVTAISRSLKALAKEIQVPVIACSQLSRSVESREDKRPQLADLRESGALEQDADLVMFVFRSEYYLTQDERKEPRHCDKIGKAEIIVAKHRNGPIGTARLSFLKEFARFENLAPAHRISDQTGPAGPQDDLPF